MRRNVEICVILALLVVVLLSCQSEESTVGSSSQDITQKIRTTRLLEPGSPLGKAYYNSQKSIQASEDFIREYPNEKDLCAGVLLRMAKTYAKQDRKKAIGVYRRAIDEYGTEIVPNVNAHRTVEESALYSIGLLERDIGNRDKALEIFGKLMKSSDFNTRTSSRIKYLATKQSHLKVTAKAIVRGKKLFSVGKRIPISISVENPTKETVIFKCYAHIEYRSYRALAPREGCEEITLAPGARYDVDLVFTEKDTNGLIPGFYQLTASLTGIPFDTSSQSVEIKK